jgi:hypothetical protein
VIAVSAPAELAEPLVSELLKGGRCRAERAEEGRRPKADAVLHVAISEFDRYDPPCIRLSVRLERGAGSGGAGDLDRLSQSASWGRPSKGGALASFDLILDARDASTREAVRAFARTQEPGAFGDDREILAVSSSYLRFVANRLAARVP